MMPDVKIGFDGASGWCEEYLRTRWLAEVQAQPHMQGGHWTYDTNGPDPLREAPQSYTDSQDRYGFWVGSALSTCVHLRGGSMRVTVGGATRTAVAEEIVRWRTAYPEPQAKEARVPVNFSFMTRQGIGQYMRHLSVPAWEEIRGNYTAPVQEALNDLMAYRPKSAGQLVLWQGPPGTGKTYALRALAWEWRDWCSMQFITDPDRFFGEGGEYIMSTVLNDDTPPYSGEGESQRWRLLVLEDAGELLTVDARKEVGQGLSRLLNLVDGFLGQGLRLLVLITTNEPISRLHPAVIRVGRCSSQITFEELTPAERVAWLRAHDVEESPKGGRLADLWEQVAHKRGPVVDVAAVPVGFRA